MFSGIYRRLFQKKQSPINEKKSAVPKRKHKMKQDSLSMEKNVNKRSKLKQQTSKLSDPRNNRSSTKHSTTIAGGKNERKSSMDRTVTSGKLPRTTNDVTKRTNSLSKQRRSGSKSSHQNIHKIKSTDEIIMDDEKISTDRRKVSTWLTNYGLHNQVTPTISTIDQQPLTGQNVINRSNNIPGNLGPNIEYMAGYYPQLSPQTRDWMPNRIYANINNNNNVNSVLNNSSRLVPVIPGHAFNNNYSMAIKKNQIKSFSNQNLGTNLLNNVTSDGKTIPQMYNQQLLLPSTKHRALLNYAMDRYEFGNDPNKLAKSYGNERVGWEYHNITLSRVPVYGFGIAVSGGRDNPHFMNGDHSIAISDVLKAGPAEGKLLVNDRVISANGISLENVDYNQAIHVLRECGNSVNLLIKRRALITSTANVNLTNANHHANADSMNNLLKITLTRNSKKEDYGIILGCKIYVKEIVNRNLNGDKENTIQEGDIINKINNTNADGLTLKEVKKLLDNSKEKVTLVVSRNINPNQNILENGNYINGHHSRSNSGLSNILYRPKWPSANGFETMPPSGSSNVPKEHPLTNQIYNLQNEPNFSGNTISAQSNANSTPFNSNIALMANSRVGNGWSNQNLYVQPPTRNDGTLTNGSTNNIHSIHAQPHAPHQSSLIQNIDQMNSSTSRSREPIKDLSFTYVDQQVENVNMNSNLDSPTTSKLSHRPLPQKPTNTIETDSNAGQVITNESNNALMNNNESNDLELMPKSMSRPGEVRYIGFQKEGSVGIRLTGGNEVGIFVTAVQPGSPAYQQGLQVGDKILKANNLDMKDFTREEAVLYLLKIKDRIELYVQNCKDEYENIVAKQKGDSFYIRVHFNYDSEGKGELSFHVGDIFHVVDTLFNGVVGSWFVYRLGRNNQEIQKGSIPNKSRADELATEQRMESKKSSSGTDLNLSETSSRRGNFFKRRRSARRSKSLSKEHWDDIVFGEFSSKFTAYERVTLKHPGFIRPVIFFGPLADIAKEKLIRDYPDKFETPQAIVPGEESKKSKLNNSGIVRLSAIKEIIDQGKHALLDITPSAVDRLNYAQFYPIVIFMRVENKSIVKELRSRSSTKNTVHRSSRKLFEQSIKLEKVWHHIFTSSITLTNGGDLWYKKLRETIDKQQAQNIWMSEFKPEESISDDFLFPLNTISRLSYASSPESDLDISMNDSKTDNENEDKSDFNIATGRLTKASSDPSLTQIDETAMNASEFDSFEQKKSKDLQNSLTKSDTNSIDQRSLNKQLPVHILLKKELAKNLEQKRHKLEEEKAINQIESDISEYPTLKIGERISTCPVGDSSNEVFETQSRLTESPLPPPPSSSLSTSKIQQQCLETPPRIDRNNKPSRFRSAHERLFGSCIAKNSNQNNNNINNNHYQMDDSDYINTTSLEYADKSLANSDMATFGDVSSHNSIDTYNKYTANPVTMMDNKQNSRSATSNDPYRFTRSTAQPVQQSSTSNSKSVTLERGKVPMSFSKMDSAYTKIPPSPPPKPIMNKIISNNNTNSLQYQMNSMSLNDNRQIPPRKPYLSGNTFENHQQVLNNNYDNMPPLYPLKVPTKRPPTIGNSTSEMSNGPPGYYQSLPQSTYGSFQSSKEPTHRYSSQAEIISNFINGTGYNNVDVNANYHSMPKERMAYINNGMNGAESFSCLNRTTPASMMDSVGMNKFNISSNYDNIRYAPNAPTTGHYMNSNSSLLSMNFGPPVGSAHNNQNNNTYLNLPYSSRTYDSTMNYNEHNGEPSPLPLPPPIPASYQPTRSNNATPNIVQPTPQQARNSQYLDLSLNRENRGSAFEVYRKPMDSNGISISGSPMFQGLPPPPPPLPVNDFNHVNYTNIDEINLSSIRFNGVGGGDSIDSINPNVIATARGVFGSEGGSLVSAETGVSIIIPPNAIPDGITQEIYFKVCEDKKLVPPLDKNKGETLLSPIVMCGPHGLRFNIPIELRLPHCAIVNPDSWSFALKSSDTNNGKPAGWRNISLNNEGDGISGNNFNEQFVSVLVDHF